MARRRKDLNNLAIDWTLSGAYAAATIWHRLAFMGPFATMPDKDCRDETARMVNEKMTAGVEGGMKAAAEAMSLLTAAALGRISPTDLMNAPAAIMNAGLQPAMRTVRANSQRLHRRALKSKR